MIAPKLGKIGELAESRSASDQMRPNMKFPVFDGHERGLMPCIARLESISHRSRGTFVRA
jgi:hypothetical protein